MEAPSWKSTVSRNKRPASSAEAGPQEGSFDAAKQAAYRILSYRDRTSHEIGLKLKEKGFSDPVISETIGFLREIGAIDDLRFARQWARSRSEHRRFGPIRLRRELTEKGISAAEAEAVLSRLAEEQDPVESAEAALAHRYRDPELLKELSARQRAFAFLQRKGFSAETIFKAFKKLGAGA